MMRSLTSESTILPNAAPMITATAKSITLPLRANSRKSLSIGMGLPPIRLRELRPSRGQSGRRSDGGLAGLAGADPYHLLHAGHEDLAVADLAGMRGLDDGLDGSLGHGVGQHDLDFHLGKEIDDVLGAAIEFRMALLPAESLDFGDRQPGGAQFGQGLADFVELERFDDSFDFFHGCSIATTNARLSP